MSDFHLEKDSGRQKDSLLIKGMGRVRDEKEPPQASRQWRPGAWPQIDALCKSEHRNYNSLPSECCLQINEMVSGHTTAQVVPRQNGQTDTSQQAHPIAARQSVAEHR